MGEDFKIKAVEIVNCGTSLQVDFRGETTGGRMFIPMRDVYKALNNEAQYAFEEMCLDMGMEKIDPSAPPEGLID